jgi:16S rRNA (guanine527-N7)-methyltransferase
MSEEKLPDLVKEAVQVLPPAMHPPDLDALLCGFLGHLLQRNREINLVSRKDTLVHLARFTRECLFLARVLQEERAGSREERAPRLLDVGTGGGFPGLVLKIAIPDLDILMVEGTRKKARFLADVAAGLDLRQARVLWGRTEELLRVEKFAGKQELRRGFDWVSGKALGTLKESAEIAEPFLVSEGIHWTFKGVSYRSELEAASGVFRERGLSLHRAERIPGDPESYVIGVRRLSPSKPRSSAGPGPRR